MVNAKVTPKHANCFNSFNSLESLRYSFFNSTQSITSSYTRINKNYALSRKFQYKIETITEHLVKFKPTLKTRQLSKGIHQIH